MHLKGKIMFLQDHNTIISPKEISSNLIVSSNVLVHIGISPVVPQCVFYLLFSPSMVQSKFILVMSLYFLALFVCLNINSSEESGAVDI